MGFDARERLGEGGCFFDSFLRAEEMNEKSIFLKTHKKVVPLQPFSYKNG